MTRNSPCGITVPVHVQLDYRFAPIRFDIQSACIRRCVFRNEQQFTRAGSSSVLAVACFSGHTNQCPSDDCATTPRQPMA